MTFQPRGATRTLTILVVEDDPLVRIDIALALSDAGFAVIEAGNAHDALDVLEARQSVDLVFTDIEMPGQIDGIGLAQAIAARWPKMPVLVTSGHRLREPIAPERFFPKPYDHKAVISQMRTLAA